MADAVSGLTAVTGLGPIPGALAAAFAELNETIARIRARDKLADAVEAAQPAIEVVAKIVDANLAELENLEQAAGLQAEARLTTRNQLMANYYEAVRAEEDRLLKKLTLLTAAKAGDGQALAQLVELDAVLAAANGGRPTAVHAEARQLEWLAQARSLRVEAATYRGDYDSYIAAARKIAEQRTAGRALLKKSRLAVRTWARSHAKLSQALEDRSPMGFIELLSVVRDVATAYQKEGAQP